MKISGIGFVYMITSPTNRIYISSTIDIDYRWNNYNLFDCKSQRKLYNSFIKHGVESHIFEIVWAGELSDMFKYETLIGWGFNVLEPENLNCKLPKLGDVYKVVSNETRINMSLSAKGKIRSKEHQTKLNESKRGKKTF